MSDESRISGVAVLYQKNDNGRIHSKVRCILVDTKDTDDEFDLKAKAERYIAGNEEMKQDFEGHDLVAWSIASQVDISKNA